MKLDKSTISLITVNMMPFFGVLFFGWTIFEVFFAYWLEILVIGLYNVLKMALSQGLAVDRDGKPLKFTFFTKIYYGVFFFCHYGFFTLFSWLIIMGVFGPWKNRLPSASDLALITWPVIIMIVSFLISHGISLFQNYIGKKEYLTTSVGKAMLMPYGRLLITTIFFFGSIFFSPLIYINDWFGLPLLALKIFLDAGIHFWEHNLMQNMEKPKDENSVAFFNNKQKMSALGKYLAIAFLALTATSIILAAAYTFLPIKMYAPFDCSEFTNYQDCKHQTKCLPAFLQRPCASGIDQETCNSLSFERCFNK